jgi:hypothetical protein
MIVVFDVFHIPFSFDETSLLPLTKLFGFVLSKGV